MSEIPTFLDELLCSTRLQKTLTDMQSTLTTQLSLNLEHFDIVMNHLRTLG